MLDYELGQANVPGGPYNDLITVGGNLVLAGTLNVSVTAGRTFDPGVYRLIDYAGTLSDNGLVFGSVPDGFTPNGDLFIQTAVPKQVNLLNEKGLEPLTFWDGGDSGLYSNGVVDGGSGTWTAARNGLSWTDADGTANTEWRSNRFAVFQGSPGTVIVDDSAGAVIFSGAQFAVDGYVIDGDPLSTDTADTILRVGDGTAAGVGMSATINSVIRGSGGLNKSDSGRLILTGANTYSGGTTISAGTLSISSDTNLGASGGSLTIASGGTLLTTAGIVSARNVELAGNGTIANGGNIDTFSGVFRGAGSLTVAGSGVTILTGDNTYAGGTTISAGTLQLGDGGSSGGIVGDIVDNGALVIDRSNSVTLAGVISGSGSLTQAGGGTTILTGDNTYTGNTSVSSGTLLVNGSIVSLATTVSSGATLGGSGNIGGDVSIQDGAHLSPGNSPGTLGIAGNLALSANSMLDYELGQANVPGGPYNDLITVGGDLVLAGRLNVSVTAGRSFDPGVYRLIDYAGTLSDNGLVFGSVPDGFTPNGDLFIQTSAPHQVNLLNEKGLGPLTFWDGGDSGLYGNGVVDGGSGTWTAVFDSREWTDAEGMVNNGWRVNRFAIFQGSSGTVTVDDSAGAVIFSGAQFAVDGYVIDGGSLSTDTAETILRVGDGTSAGVGMSATISSVIRGSGGLNKSDSGRLILTGANTYSGGTTISAGTLSISSDANLGASGGSLTIASGGTLLTTAGIVSARNVELAGNGTIANGGNIDTFSGVFRGAGSLTVAGSGVTILTGDNTYAGGTTISAGTLQLGDGGSSGGIVGDIVDNGALVIDRSNSVTLAGVISGSGSLTQAGGGTTILTGDNTYAGGTTISTGTLQLGSGGSSGSIVGDITDNAALVIDRS